MRRHPIRALRFPRGAYDGALNEAAAAELFTFLQTRLSEADLAEFCRRAGIDSGMTADSDPDGGPPGFKGMPEPGGTKFGMDGRRRARPPTAAEEADYKARFPNVARIGLQP
jgi:hypothetical protein